MAIAALLGVAAVELRGSYFDSAGSAWSPSLMASCSLMYLPCLVLPYHLEPCLW